MRVGGWIGDYRYLLAVDQRHDGSTQHRFVHRGGQWAMLFKADAGATDEDLAARVAAYAPRVEAEFAASDGTPAAFVIGDAGVSRLAFTGRQA